MRRCLYIIEIMILILSSSIFAQVEEDETTTKGWANGRYWQILDKNAKIQHLYGIEAGVFLFSQELLYKAKTESEWNRIKEYADSLGISGFRFSEVVQQIDMFFEDRSNIRIPVAYAYYYSIKKISGETQKVLENYLAILRRKWNK